MSKSESNSKSENRAGLPAEWETPPLMTIGDTTAWLFDMDEDRFEALESLVSGQEAARGARLRNPIQQKRWLRGRGLLRVSLAHWLGTTPGGVEFEYNEQGKPRIASDRMGHIPLASQLRFNISHCRNSLLLAISSRGELGVDIEGVERHCDYLSIARHQFPPEDVRRLELLQESGRAEEFYRVWTLREAAMKAAGTGLSVALAIGSMPVKSLDGEFDLTTVTANNREQRWRVRQTRVFLCSQAVFAVLVAENSADSAAVR
jgi:4'-phosphopantetheinyl transferase